MVSMITENGIKKSENGKFLPTYSESSILKAVGDGSTTPEIADEVGCTSQAARYRLNKLSEAGEVERRRIGQTDLWTRTE